MLGKTEGKHKVIYTLFTVIEVLDNVILGNYTVGPCQCVCFVLCRLACFNLQMFSLKTPLPVITAVE